MVELRRKSVVVAAREHVVDVGLELVVFRDVWEELVVVLQEDFIIESGLRDGRKGTERVELGHLSFD